jgi:D-alanyl-D-alanine carboxypeptidase
MIRGSVAVWLIAAAIAWGAWGACGGASPAPEPPKPPVGDLGVDVANLNAQLPPYLASIGAGSQNRALSGYVLVAQHDQVLYGHGFGFADRAAQRAPTADTSFRTGSVTKQFTAAAILRLEQDGELTVEDPVGKHLPDYAGPGKDVTIHQLLTHTTGIPNYTAIEAVMARRGEPFTVRELLATFADQPLEFPPGTKFKYSNSNYAILGAIIERASGMPYRTYLAERLFKPAGLASTEVGDAAGAADRAEGYRIENGTAVPAKSIDMSLPFAAGAVRSTANDLMRWLEQGGLKLAYRR